VTGKPLPADTPDPGASPGTRAQNLQDLALLAETLNDAAGSAGCEVWESTLVGVPGRRYLRLYIDRPGGVDIAACGAVSRAVHRAIDDDPRWDDVELEVSSPGAERKLRDMDEIRRFIGERARVRFRRGDSEVIVEGTLLVLGAETLEVQARTEVVDVPLADLIDARLAVDFGTDDRPPRGARR
jgi:ribosome maturation factor RimP